MAENLGIKILAGLLEKETINQIQNDLKKIEPQIKKLGLSFDTKGLQQEIQKVSKDIKQGLQKAVEVDVNDVKQNFSSITEAVNKYENEFKSSTQSITKYIDKQSGNIKHLLLTLKDAEGTIRLLRLEPRYDDAGNLVYRLDGIYTELNKANVEREKALRYEQEIRMMIEKIRQQEQKRTEEIEYQIEKAKQLARIRRQDLERRYGSILTPEQKQQLDHYIDSMNRITKDTPNAKREIDRLNTSFKSIQANVATAGSKVDTFGHQLGVALTRVPIWMGAMTAFYAPLRGLQNAIEQIIMLDSQMTELKRVMDATPSTYNRLMEESIALSSELGNRIEDVNNALVEFARQGFDQSTLMALTETATIAANISDLSTEDAMSTITAGMKAFNIEASNSISIIDKLNEVDNSFAIDTATLSEAMMKSAATANTFGVSMDELLGHIAAIGITTRESGSVIGNSLKSIYSRLTTLQPSIDMLEFIGVAVRDASGEMRSATDILNDLANVWNTLDAATQQNLATTIAGRYQLSRFLTLMQQWNTAIEVTNTSLNSQGSAMEEQVKYSESLEARLNRLSNAGVSLAESLGSAFLTDGIVTFTESIANLANTYEGLIETIGFLGPTLALVGVAVGTFSTKIRTLATDIIFAENAQQRMIATSNLLKRTLRGLAAATGIGLLFGAIGWVFEKTINSIGESIREAEEFKRVTDELVDSFTSNRQEIESLVDEYENLHNNTARTAEQEERYVVVANRLGELLPSIVESKDEEGNARLRNVDAINKEIESLKELSSIDAQKFIDNFSDAEQKIKDKISDIKDEIKSLYEEQGIINTDFSGSFGSYNAAIVNPASELSDPTLMREELLLTRQQEAAQRELTQAYIDYANAIAVRDGMTRQLNDAELEYINKIIESKGYTKEAQDAIELYVGSLARLAPEVRNAFSNDAIAQMTNQQITLINNLTQAIKDQQNGIKNTDEQIERYIQALERSGVSGVNLKTITYDLSAAIRESKEEIESSTGALGDNTDALDENSEAKWENASMSEILAGVTADEVSKMEQAIKIVALLSQMENLSAQQKALLADATGYLSDMYPHLNGRIAENIDWLIAEVEMLSSLNDASGKFASGMMTNQDNLTMSTIEASNQRILALQKEAKVLQDIVDAHKAAYADSPVIPSSGFISHIINTRIPQVQAELSKAYSTRRDVVYGSGIVEKPSGRGSSGRKSGSKSSQSKSPEEIAWEKAEKALQKYINRLEDYEYKINREQLLREHMDEGSAEYAASIQREIKLIQQQQSEIKRYRNAINNIIKQDKISADRKRELTERLQELDLQYLKLNNQIQDYLKTQREELADSSLDLLEKMYQKRIELLEAERDKELKILDERLANYEKHIRDKIEALNREYEREDFEQKRIELIEEQAKIQHEIDILSLDNSESAQARRIELEEELKRLKDELADLEKQRDRTLREQNLQDELEAMQEETEAKKSAIQERYDAEIYTLQELLKNEQHFADLREQIINGNVKNIQNLLKKYVNEFKTYNKTVIEELGLSWQEMINLMNQYNNIQNQAKNSSVTSSKSSSSSSKSSSSSTSGSSSSKNSNSSSKSTSSLPLRKRSGGFATPKGGWNMNSIVDYLKSRDYYADFEDREKLYKYFKGSGTYQGTATQNSWLLSKLKAHGLKTGGYTGDNEGFKYLHKHEMVLNANDTDNFKTAIKYTRDLFRYIPNFDRFKPSFAGMNMPQRPINVYFGNVYGATQEQAKTFGEKFINHVKRIGGM